MSAGQLFADTFTILILIYFVFTAFQAASRVPKEFITAAYITVLMPSSDVATAVHQLQVKNRSEKHNSKGKRPVPPSIYHLK